MRNIFAASKDVSTKGTGVVGMNAWEVVKLIADRLGCATLDVDRNTYYRNRVVDYIKLAEAKHNHPILLNTKFTRMKPVFLEWLEDEAPKNALANVSPLTAYSLIVNGCKDWDIIDGANCSYYKRTELLDVFRALQRLWFTYLISVCKRDICFDKPTIDSPFILNDIARVFESEGGTRKNFDKAAKLLITTPNVTQRLICFGQLLVDMHKHQQKEITRQETKQRIKGSTLELVTPITYKDVPAIFISRKQLRLTAKQLKLLSINDAQLLQLFEETGLLLGTTTINSLTGIVVPKQWYDLFARESQ